MYEAHFGFTQQPFGLTPNTAFFLKTPGHLDALNMLQVALANGEGFIKVVGEVGTGKTLLCRQLMNTLDEQYITAYIPNPFLTPTALYRSLAEELGIHCRSRDTINNYQKAINERLIEWVGNGKKVVLLIDEAQAMPSKTLETIRLISNLETESCKLIQIVLFGQPELDQLLAHSSLRQLRQRISFSCQLPALDRQAVRLYINHRLSKAGSDRLGLFSDRAVDLISSASGGVPRLINILCHKSLMSAYGKGAQSIELIHAKAAVADTEDATMPQTFGWLGWGMSAATLAVFGIGLYLLLPGAWL